MNGTSSSAPQNMTFDSKAPFLSSCEKNGLGSYLIGWWRCCSADCTSNSAGSASRSPRGNTALPQFHYMQNWNEFNRMCLSLSHRMSHTLFCFFITGTRHQLQKIQFTSKHIVCCFLYLKKKNQFSWGLVLFLSFCDVVSLGSVRHQQWFSPKSQSVLLV